MRQRVPELCYSGPRGDRNQAFPLKLFIAVKGHTHPLSKDDPLS